MPSLSIYAHTISHLSLRQILYRLIRTLARGTRIDPDRLPRAVQANDYVLEPLARAGICRSYAFRFLNETKQFNPGRFNWACPDMDKLWRYNLHYFDYLHDQGLSRRQKSFLIGDWIRHNPQGSADAWEPFPVSLRIVNWIKFFCSQAAGRRPEWLQSLYIQALWLEGNLEYHLRANHLFKNLKALVFAGCFFKGRDAQRWLAKGMRLLRRELAEQILPDGGHFERSPMYHSMVLEDLLDLIQLLKLDGRSSNIVAALEETVGRMARFLLALSHPDESIALFNDAALGIEPPPMSLAGYLTATTGHPPAKPVGHLSTFTDSGYYVMHPGPLDRMIIDCGPVGPDYQPGHAHCDLLSFELSLHGRRIVVDSGCCQYIDGALRQYNRGNQGHNTITLDGCNQSEVWGAHRCARRAYPLQAYLLEDERGALIFEGAHDGYTRLPGRPVHHRRIRWEGPRIGIEDRIEGMGRHMIESRLHLHPEVHVTVEHDAVLLGDRDGPLAAVTATVPSALETCSGWYCPEFGIRHRCTVIRQVHRDQALPFETGWLIESLRTRPEPCANA